MTPNFTRGVASRAERGGILAKLIVLIILVVLCFLIYLVRAPVLRLAGGYWVVSAPPAACDAIVILSDDDFTADRAARAAELYHAGWAPRIVASGRWLRPYASIAELMQRDLETRGVPKQAILPFAHEAPDTLEELKDIRRFVEQHGWKRVMIVTSNYHTRRTRYLAAHVFPGEIAVLIEAAPDVNYDPDSWWRTREGLKIFSHEAVGMVVAIWEVDSGGGNSKPAMLLPLFPFSEHFFLSLCLQAPASVL
ncbi:MAG: YdcF family protein [Candidatus Acidiferrales bacterium]